MENIPIDVRVLYGPEDTQALLLNKGKIIFVTEDIPDYLSNPIYGTTFLSASSLLPDYGCISYYLDNNMTGFAASYEDYLHKQDCTLYFVTIISAIINSIPLGFVFGKEEIEIVATRHLLDFMARNFGICISTDPGIPSYMDCRFIASNACHLYRYGLLTSLEFLLIYPTGMLIDPVALQALIYDLRPPLRNPNDPSEAQKYFMDYCAALKETKPTNRILTDPFVMMS